MGVSTDGILVFGIDFDEEFPLYEGREDDLDLDEIILRSANIDRAYYDDYDSYAKNADAELDRAGVELIYHCLESDPMYILAVRGAVIHARRGYPEEIKPEDLIVTEKQMQKLKDFCDKYKLECSEPKWFLCSMWG